MKRRLVELLEHERIRFLLVGGINTAVGYALFVIFQLTIGQVIGYLGSLYLSYAVAVTVAFVLHRRVTFRVHGTGSIVVDFLRFASVYVVSLGINTIGLPLLVELGRLPPIGAQAVMVIVATLISYIGHKYLSFRRGGEESIRPPQGAKEDSVN